MGRVGLFLFLKKKEGGRKEGGERQGEQARLRLLSRRDLFAKKKERFSSASNSLPKDLSSNIIFALDAKSHVEVASCRAEEKALAAFRQPETN